ncbi:MAG: hypothetical protein ACFHVJ_02550 [Aestuariibacter sp.]
MQVRSTKGRALTLVSCLFALGYASVANAASVSGKYTHNLSVPSSVTEGGNIGISWSPKSTYNHINFSFVKVGVKKPGQSSYSYTNYSGASGSQNYSANTEGQWCFRARGWASGDGFGLFSESCTQVNPINVKHQVTHNVLSPSGGTTELNSSVNVRWGIKPEFSSVHFNWVKVYVKRPDGTTFHNNYSGSSTSIQVDQSGNWCFRVRGNAPDNGGMGSYTGYSCTTVVAPPPKVSGTASVNVPDGALRDNWFSDKDKLQWNVTSVNNATSYKIIINNSITRNVSAAYSKVSFDTSLVGSFNTNDTISLELQGCNNQGCKTVSSGINLTLVKTSDLPFYDGKPKHINQFSSEMKYSSTRKKDGKPSSLYGNKRWKFANWDKNWSLTSYDVDLIDVFRTYLYQYDLPESTYNPTTLQHAAPNYNKPVFDAFSFVNQEFKVVDGGGPFSVCNQMPNAFIEGKPNQSSGYLTDCVNDYLDLLFGSKMSRKVIPGVNAPANQGTFEYYAKKNQSLLDALHEAAKNSPHDIAFYMVIPSGIVDETTTTKRRKMFIHEALEQYALWLAEPQNQNTKVRLAGFYQQQESTPNPKGGASAASKAASQLRIHRAVRDTIKSYSSQLTYNSSSYNTLGSYKDPVRYSTICPDLDTTLEDCLIRFTAVRHAEAVALFDNVEFQPNVGLLRFKNRSPLYEHPVVGPVQLRVDTLPSDMEMLHWYNIGLFTPLAEDRHLLDPDNNVNTLFGIHFEYNSLFEDRAGIRENYNIAALNGEGYYGDISRYADYMMTEYPEEYLTGPNSIIYDDAGGLLYCHIKHAVGQYSGNKQCRDSDRGDGKLVLSISDVRSMYAWMDATREVSESARRQTYRTNTQFTPNTPIHLAAPSVSTVIDVTNGENRIDFQSLVRARLTEEFLHSGTKSSECTKRAKLRLEFTLSNGTKQTEEKYFPIAALQCDNFLQSKDNIFNKITPELQAEIYARWDPAQHGTKPASASHVALDISDLQVSLDEDQWKLFEVNDIVIPANTTKITMSLMATELSANDEHKVEGILYYRPDYRLYRK